MTNEENKTKELIARAKSGDQQAFADLYDSYYAYAYRAIGDIIIDQGEREDVVQEAFLRCFTKLQQGESVENFGGFIATAAKNIAIDHIKAREAEKRPKEVLSSFGQSDGDAEEDDRDLFDAERSEVQKELERASEFYQTPEERFEEQEVAEIIQEILAELPDYQQEALSLFYLEGMKQKEIAELYGVSVDTIKSRINQGKKKVEAKVIEIEKKKGIKLHSFAPLSFFFSLLRQKATAEAAAMPAAKCLSAGAKVGAKSAADAATKSAAKEFFSKTVAIAGKEISMKTIVAVVVGTVAIGGAIGVSLHNNQKQANSLSYHSSDSAEEDSVYESIEDDNNETEVNEDTELEDAAEESVEILKTEDDTFQQLSDLEDGEYFTQLASTASPDYPVVTNIEFEDGGFVVTGNFEKSVIGTPLTDTGVYYFSTNADTVYCTGGPTDYDSPDEIMSLAEFQERYGRIRDSWLGLKINIINGVVTEVRLTT